jgi:hypothetical protein
MKETETSTKEGKDPVTETRTDTSQEAIREKEETPTEDPARVQEIGRETKTQDIEKRSSWTKP